MLGEIPHYNDNQVTDRSTMMSSGLVGSIFLGQLVSLMDTISALCVKLFASKTDVQFPILQYVITYFFICIVAVIPYTMERRKQKKLKDEEALSPSPAVSAEGLDHSPHLELTPLSLPYAKEGFKARGLQDRKMNAAPAAGWKVALGHPRILTESGLSADIETIRKPLGDSPERSLSVDVHDQSISTWMIPTCAPTQSPSLYIASTNDNITTMTTPVKPLVDLLKGCSSDVSTAASDSTGRISLTASSPENLVINGHISRSLMDASALIQLSPSQKRGLVTPVVTASPASSPCQSSSEWGATSLMSHSPSVEPKEGTEVGSTTTTAGLGTSASVSCASMWSRGTSPIQSPMRSPLGHSSYANAFDDDDVMMGSLSQRLEQDHRHQSVIINSDHLQFGELPTSPMDVDHSLLSTPYLHHNVPTSSSSIELNGSINISHSNPSSALHQSSSSSLSSSQLDDATLDHMSNPCHFNSSIHHGINMTSPHIVTAQHRTVRARSPPSSSTPTDDGGAVAIAIHSSIPTHPSRGRLSGFPTLYQSGQPNDQSRNRRRGHSACPVTHQLHHDLHHHHSCSLHQSPSRSPSPNPIGKQRQQCHSAERSISLSPQPSTDFIVDSSHQENRPATTGFVADLIEVDDEDGDDNSRRLDTNTRHHRHRSNSWDSSDSSSSVGQIHRHTGRSAKGKRKNGFQRIQQRRESSEEESIVGHHGRVEPHKPLKTSSSFESMDDDEETDDGSSLSSGRQDSTKHCLKKGSKGPRALSKRHRTIERSSYPGTFGYLGYQRDRISAWLWSVFAVGTPAFYILVAFLDVQGGTLTVVAFNYANLASCCLIDWISLLTAFVLSVKFMGEKATKSHVVALLVGLVGSLCILVSDSMAESEQNSALTSSLTTPVPSNPISPAMVDALSSLPLSSHLRQVIGSGLVTPAVSLDDATVLPNGVVIEASNVGLSNMTSVVEKPGMVDYLKETFMGRSHLDIYPLGERSKNKTASVPSKPEELRSSSRSLLDANETLPEDQQLISDGVKELELTSSPPIHQRSISREERLFGDVMCLLAATFLGIVTVMMEKALVVGVPSSELLFKTFFPALIIGCIEFLIFEAHKIPDLTQLSLISWVYLFFAAVTMSCAYVLAPVVLQRSSSAFFNLSLLTSAGLAVLFSALLLGDPFPPLYSVGLVSILGSLIIYHHEAK